MLRFENYLCRKFDSCNGRFIWWGSKITEGEKVLSELFLYSLGIFNKDLLMPEGS